MSMHSDYEFAVLFRQRHHELVARAAEDRRAAQLPHGGLPWWRRLVLSRTTPSIGTDRGAPDVTPIRMFIAGDDEAAKQTVTALLAEFGWPVVDLGGIQSSRWLEALSLAWVVYSRRTGNTHHAFKLVGK